MHAAIMAVATTVKTFRRLEEYLKKIQIGLLQLASSTLTARAQFFDCTA